MLGVRLKPDEEAMLERHAKSVGRTKSALVREWINERLARELDLAKLRRAVDIINAATTADDYAWHAARASETARHLDEEDGGFDWGPGAPS